MIRIESLMQTDFPVLSPAMPMRRAVSVLIDAKAAAAPVVDESGSLVGILTQKDCFRTALHASYYDEWTGTVAERMSREVLTLDTATDLVSAAETFAEIAHRVLPVMNGGRLVGLLPRSLVLGALVRGR